MKTVALSEVAEFIDYGVTASANSHPVGPKFLRITDIQDGAVDWSSVPFCDAKKSTLTSRCLRSGDIVFARTGATTGKSFLIRSCPEGAVFASYLIRVRPNLRIDPGFLAHFFDSPAYWSQISLKAVGAAQPGVNSSKLKELRIPLPPIAEQRRIATILDQADELRRKRRGGLKTLERLPQSFLVEMFGCTSSDTSNYATFPLMRLCVRITDGTHQAPRWSESGVPFIFVSNIRDRMVSLNTDKFVSQETYNELTRNCPIELGDVLYTAVGSYGNAAVVREKPPFVFQRHIAHIKPDKSKLDPQFLEIVLESPALRQQADRVANGVAQKTVTLSDLKHFSIICPPLDLQRAFAKRVQLVDQLKADCRAHVAGLDRLFESLQHRAFGGELTSGHGANELEMAG